MVRRGGGIGRRLSGSIKVRQLPVSELASVNLLYSVLYCSTNDKCCAGAVPASPGRSIAMMAWPNFNGFLSTILHRSVVPNGCSGLAQERKLVALTSLL